MPTVERAIYMVLEKILTGTETLREGLAGSWNDRLRLCQSSRAAPCRRFGRNRNHENVSSLLGHSVHFGHLVYAKKRLVMRLSLANDVNVLGNMLDRLSEQNRWFRDFTLDAIGRAVRETIACFPVYRTYLAPGVPINDEDRAVIDRAVRSAKRRNPGIEESVFNYLRDVLLFHFPENVEEEARAAHEHFVLKFQQSTGPIMAKGLEDTAFYIYNRLAALNEVGGEPQQFGLTREAFHRTQRCSAARLAGDSARHFHARHETKRGRARTNARDFRDPADCGGASLHAGDRRIAAGKNKSTKRTRRMRMRNICFTKPCSASGRLNLPVQRRKASRRSLSSAFRHTWRKR